MTRSWNQKTIVLLGSCFGGFTVVAFATFTIIFLKMGIEPRWYGAAQPCRPAATGTGIESPGLARAGNTGPGTATATATAPAPLLQFAALVFPRPDTRGRVPALVSPLAAPVLLAPEGDARPVQTDSVEFRWNAVTGAAHYHLHVWQQHEGDETTLLDNDLEVTQVKVQLVHPAPVQWELQAVDAQGKAGESARSPAGKTSK